MDEEVTLIKFGKWIDYGKSHPRAKKSPRKGAWSRDRFGMKPYCLNFTNASTMASATPGVKNSSRNGCGVGHMIVV